MAEEDTMQCETVEKQSPIVLMKLQQLDKKVDDLQTKLDAIMMLLQQINSTTISTSSTARQPYEWVRDSTTDTVIYRTQAQTSSGSGS